MTRVIWTYISKDPRQVLMKRLNDWFKDLYQTRSNTQNSSREPATASSSSESSSNSASSLSSDTPSTSTLASEVTETGGQAKSNESAMETERMESPRRRRSDESISQSTARTSSRNEGVTRAENEEPVDPEDEAERLDFEKRRREDMISLK